MEYVFFPSNHYTSHLIGELFIIYLDLLSCSILENCNILDLLLCIALCMTGRSRTSRLWSYDHVFYSIVVKNMWETYFNHTNLSETKSFCKTMPYFCYKRPEIFQDFAALMLGGKVLWTSCRPEGPMLDYLLILCHLGGFC